MKKKYNIPEINPFVTEHDKMLVTSNDSDYEESKETTFDPSEVWDEK